MTNRFNDQRLTDLGRKHRIVGVSVDPVNFQANSKCSGRLILMLGSVQSTCPLSASISKTPMRTSYAGLATNCGCVGKGYGISGCLDSEGKIRNIGGDGPGMG